MKLPKKISPCPILESIVEIRFESKIPPEAVFGVVYSVVQAEFPGEVQKMPILQLPEEVRSNDPNLIYQAHYRLTSGNYILSIGPKVIAFSCSRPYSGWAEYSQKIQDLLSKIIKANIISKTLRFGLRYLNHFEGNIFDNIKLGIALDGVSLPANQNYVRTIFQSNQFTMTLQVANNSDLVSGKLHLKGSLIDIDTAITKSNLDILNVTTKLLESAHDEEKKLFFRLLSDDFLKTFNPEY